MPKGESARVELVENETAQAKKEKIKGILKQGKMAKETVKGIEQTVVEDLPTIKEVVAPTILETEKKDEPEIELTDDDVMERMELVAPKAGASSLDVFLISNY